MPTDYAEPKSQSRYWVGHRWGKIVEKAFLIFDNCI
jgi:hypothetical protein